MRAQRAVEKTLQHSGVQHVVGLRVRCPPFLQFIKARAERQPLRNADGQLAFFFELLENLEVVPVCAAVFCVGVVLHRSDSRTRDLLQRGFNRLAALVRGW